MTTARETTDWDVAVGTGLLRLAAGSALLRWRGPLARRAGAAPDDRLATALFGYFGVRDIAVGLSALAASRPGSDVRRQLVLQGIADSTDTAILAFAVSRGRFPRVRGAGLVAVAAVTAMSEYAAAWWLPRRNGY